MHGISAPNCSLVASPKINAKSHQERLIIHSGWENGMAMGHAPSAKTNDSGSVNLDVSLAVVVSRATITHEIITFPQLKPTALNMYRQPHAMFLDTVYRTTTIGRSKHDPDVLAKLVVSQVVLNDHFTFPVGGSKRSKKNIIYIINQPSQILVKVEPMKTANQSFTMTWGYWFSTRIGLILVGDFPYIAATLGGS